MGKQSTTLCVISSPLLPKGTTWHFCIIFARATLTWASLNRSLLFSGSHWHLQFPSFWHLNSINMLFTPSSGLLMENTKIQSEHPHIHMQHVRIPCQLLVWFNSAEVTNSDKCGFCCCCFVCLFFLRTSETTNNLISAFQNINSINTWRCTPQLWHVHMI